MSTVDDHTAGGSEEITSSKEECTSCEQTNTDNITADFNSVDIRDDKSTCAACGKEGNSDNMNNCNKCEMVKYCNAACKKKHRKKHKKACEKRLAELHDEALFKEPPPGEECPICMLTLPHETNTSVFMSCCGKSICCGCDYAMTEGRKAHICPYCRMPPASSVEERFKRIKKLMDKSNASAFNHLGGYYLRGESLPQDYQKANELYLKAGELGCASAYYNLGTAFDNGRGVEVDKKKANYYWELAAMGGNVQARYNVGHMAMVARNHRRAIKHFLLGARSGEKCSLNAVALYYKKGVGGVTKDEYTNTLRAYQTRQDEMKSVERDKYKAASEM